MNSARRLLGRVLAALNAGERCVRCGDVYGTSRLLGVERAGRWVGICEDCWHDVAMLALAAPYYETFARDRGIIP